MLSPWTMVLSLLLPIFLHWLFRPVLSDILRRRRTTVTEVDLSPPDKGREDPEQILLSIIVPAYNEEERLPIMLEQTMSHLFINDGGAAAEDILRTLAPDQPKPERFTVEIIVVDDGSTDGTIDAVRRAVRSLPLDTAGSHTVGPSLRCISVQPNGGKGAAVQAGMLAALSSARPPHYLLMADADGATDVRDLNALCRSVRGHEVAVGSRAHLRKSPAVQKRSFVRNLLMGCFHLAVRAITSISSVEDTQCGFKLFGREAAEIIFGSIHLGGWAFDIEVLTVCLRENMTVAEVPVRWTEVDGSKLDTGGKWRLLVVSLGMLRDMICVRLCYTLGIWRVQKRRREKM